MRVLLRPEIFRAEHQLELMVLLWLGKVGRHRVIPEPLDSEAQTLWLQTLEMQSRLLWSEMVDESLERERFEPSHFEIAVVKRAEAAWQRPTPEVPLRAAVDLLLQPYRVVLENNVNDRAFLVALAERRQAQVLRAAEERAWLVFEMGGGSAVVPRIAALRRSEEARRLASVLLDSDALRPAAVGQPRSQVEGLQARRAREVAGDAELGVHLHVLWRRSIENYLPQEALVRWARGNPGRRTRVEAFKRLTDAQRHHFNMKEGFAGDEPQRARVGDLFDEVLRRRPRLREDLRGGFGRDIADLFHHAVRDGEIDGAARREVSAFVSAVLERLR